MSKEKNIKMEYVPGCGPEKDRLCCSKSAHCYKESIYLNGKIVYTGLCCNDSLIS